ncbi:hypothetical protein L0F63_000957 [Massospora cicadina]|nr:hypothetical protein L0F63_000957 [Massospora cicadina]
MEIELMRRRIFSREDGDAFTEMVKLRDYAQTLPDPERRRLAAQIALSFGEELDAADRNLPPHQLAGKLIKACHGEAWYPSSFSLPSVNPWSLRRPGFMPVVGVELRFDEFGLNAYPGLKLAVWLRFHAFLA